MTFRQLQSALRTRLNQSDRGDRGWWLLTRVHLTPARLKVIAGYLNDAGAANGLTLTRRHYRDLATALEIGTASPRQTINRHYFLAMQTPLRLLNKLDRNSWEAIELTNEGVRLATQESAVAVFEQLLREIRFCREPWYTASRVAEYEEFDVLPYPAALDVMNANGGYIDIDEFDLFVSRIRSRREIGTASAQVAEFRELTEGEKAALKNDVRKRIPRGSGTNPFKLYDNWRDMARHTFSLFALGESALRIGNQLFLSGTLSESAPKQDEDHDGERRQRPWGPAVSRRHDRPPMILRIPNVEAPDELLDPPTPPQGNTGTDAELLIGKILTADGWQVVYYSQRRGYGFDLWAKKDAKAFLIEVKSFSGQGSSIGLTPLEHQAAARHGENFLLAIVERAATDNPVIHVIQDPVRHIRFQERNLSQYSAARTAWIVATSDVFGTRESAR